MPADHAAGLSSSIPAPHPVSHGQLGVLSLFGEDSHAWITTTTGSFAKAGEAAADLVAACPGGGAYRGTTFAAAAFTTRMRLPCERGYACSLI